MLKLKIIRHTLFASVFVIPCIYGCGDFLPGSKGEGIIEYEITYPDESMQDNFMAPFMPKKTLISFKNNKTVSEINIGLGLMQIIWVADPEEQKLITMVKITSKKYALIQDSNAVNEQLNKTPPPSVKFTEETKTIAGYKCKKAVVTDANNTTYDVFYTEEIKIKNPNWFIPLREIKGVLLEYQIKQNEIVMKLTATAVKKEKTEDKLFKIPDDYKIVSKEEMPEAVSQFFQ